MVDVGQHTTGRDGGLVEHLVGLLVIANGKLDVTGVHVRRLVVLSSVAGQLKHLGAEDGMWQYMWWCLVECGVHDGM